MLLFRLISLTSVILLETRPKVLPSFDPSSPVNRHGSPGGSSGSTLFSFLAFADPKTSARFFTDFLGLCGLATLHTGLVTGCLYLSLSLSLSHSPTRSLARTSARRTKGTKLRSVKKRFERELLLYSPHRTHSHTHTHTQ